MIKEVTVDSWEMFENCIGKYIDSPAWSGKFAFRGQANSTWGLQPSLLRIIENTPGFPKLSAIKVEKQALTYFASRVINYRPLPLPRDPENMLDWWPLMQHYGVPTRLLDWTRSPYVAAYFAVQEIQTKGDDEGMIKMDGSVYYVPFTYVNKATKKANNGDPLRGEQFSRTDVRKSNDGSTLIYFGIPQQVTERMAAQQGMYSVCLSPLIDHDKAIKKRLSEERGIDHYGKIIIPHNLKQQFAQRLNYMGITASSLFPGMDGLGREIKEFITHQIITNSTPEGSLRADPVMLDVLGNAISEYQETVAKITDMVLSSLRPPDQTEQDSSSQMSD